MIDLNLGTRTVIHQLVTVVGGAYVLAGIPIGAFALLGRVTPAFALPRQTLLVYWGWFAVAITGSALAADLLL